MFYINYTYTYKLLYHYRTFLDFPPAQAQVSQSHVLVPHHASAKASGLITRVCQTHAITKGRNDARSTTHRHHKEQPQGTLIKTTDSLRDESHSLRPIIYQPVSHLLYIITQPFTYRYKIYFYIFMNH